VTEADSRNILLLWGDAKERQTVFRILCATGADVHFDVSPTLERPLCQYRMIVVDYDSVREEAEGLLAELSRMKDPPAVLVVTASSDRDDLTSLLAHDALTNLIAKNADVRANELVVTAQKIIRRDIFGFEKYLTWGTYPYEVVINDSEAKDKVLDQLERYLERIGCNRRLIALARGVGDEFIMNAVYNAPVDADGKPKYASLPRTQRVCLEPHEAALFRFACDGRYLGLSIRDNFGRLKRETVQAYLRKGFRKGEDQIDEKEGGAGLGIYYIFESLNHLVINIEPKKCSEMIGLMDISGNYRDFAERPKSLNIFVQEESR
jgi:hypothetical protein